MSIARSLPVNTRKSGRTRSRSASRSHSSCRLSEECLAPMHEWIPIMASYAPSDGIRPYGTNIAPSSKPMNRSTRSPIAASAATHPSSSSVLSPYDGKITGVPPADAIASHAAKWPSRSKTAPGSSGTYAPATKSLPATTAVRASTSRFWSSVSSCTYPVSMLTAGVRPASTVRLMCASVASQSISPSAVNGSNTADNPVIVRRGRMRPAFTTRRNDEGCDGPARSCEPRRHRRRCAQPVRGDTSRRARCRR